MGLGRILCVFIFVVIQIVAIALGIAALIVPVWIDPKGGRFVRLIEEETWLNQNQSDEICFETELCEQVSDVGLWQICLEPFSIVNTSSRITFGDFDDAKDIGKKFEEIGEDDCKSGEIVEDFYADRNNFKEDSKGKLIGTRALVVLFVIFSVTKLLFMIYFKCREIPGKISVAGLLLFVILETGCGVGALILYGMIYTNAVDQYEEDSGDSTDLTDYSGLGYWLFLVAASAALLADIGICVVLDPGKQNDA
eukprot:TRINITY_DN20605_c1_g1_i1.p3 TRINITY_DN20605_c1_g1~~TRINITY_DN20605_c1_g1_i1.p3  ORF type:complete len:261 (-),score=28.94 TRINITY_DN20605_c1_g1_i1:119-874(-)